MKTLKNITALLSILAILFTVNLNASNFSFNEEAYINDIPFNTEDVYNEIMNERNLAQFDFEDEAYIDDIPFDTKCISVQCLYKKALEADFYFEEETYINDIPFDTYQTAVQVAYTSAIEQVYDFNEETYIDDIPVELFISEKRNKSIQLVLHENSK